jgi:hypothetical protein
VHDVSPLFEVNVPIGHCWQKIAPLVPVKVPAGQSSQGVLPVSLRVPGGQTSASARGAINNAKENKNTLQACCGRMRSS